MLRVLNPVSHLQITQLLMELTLTCMVVDISIWYKDSSQQPQCWEYLSFPISVVSYSVTFRTQSTGTCDPYPILQLKIPCCTVELLLWTSIVLCHRSLGLRLLTIQVVKLFRNSLSGINACNKVVSCIQLYCRA